MPLGASQIRSRIIKKPDIPDNETERLEALTALDILDTPHEERFDRLTRIASRIFGVPIALVSLVDRDRQWFKSAEGLSATETPRDISFCGHAIMGKELLVVNDTAVDQRFVDNPLVTGDPKIRFYAGCPLTNIGGYNLGTICLIDRQPRAFSEEEEIILRDLAAMVERELQLTELATIDELTGALNRRGFNLLAEQNLKLCRRKGLPASLVYFDVDKFKHINDNHGHAEGDRVLTAVADTMKAVSRDSDVFARFGGDEFVVLCTDAPPEVAQAVVDRFDRYLDEFAEINTLPYSINLSHGIIDFDPEAHASIADLLTAADEQMYRRKRG